MKNKTPLALTLLILLALCCLPLIFLWILNNIDQLASITYQLKTQYLFSKMTEYGIMIRN